MDTLFAFYIDTLNKCGSFLLLQDDETIEYNVYEEFDIGVHSFFHKDNLNTLYDQGLLTLSNVNKSLLLRQKLVALQQSDEWDIAYFRTSEKWKEIMTLADEIKATL